MISAATSGGANWRVRSHFYHLYHKTGVYASTYVLVLAHYGGCMVVVWWLYGGSLAEVALCSTHMLISSPREQHELQTQSAPVSPA